MKHYKLAQSIAHFALIGMGFYFLTWDPGYAFICYCIIGALQVVDTSVNFMSHESYPWLAERKWHGTYLLIVLGMLLVGGLFEAIWVLLAYFLLLTSPVVAFLVLCSITIEAKKGFTNRSESSTSDPEIMEVDHFF